jgi:hypothetical protein
MNLIYTLYLLPFLVSCEKIIKNINIPACRNCIHYNPDVNFDYTSRYNKCDNFGEKNIITNEINYDYVESCRRDESMCGKYGKYFVEEPNVNVKIFNFNLKKLIPFIIWPTIFVLLIFIPNIIIPNIIK